LTLTEDELLQAANRWEIRHGGVSGRTAQQFINYIAGMPEGVKGATGKPPCAPAAGDRLQDVGCMVDFIERQHGGEISFVKGY